MPENKPVLRAIGTEFELPMAQRRMGVYKVIAHDNGRREVIEFIGIRSISSHEQRVLDGRAN